MNFNRLIPKDTFIHDYMQYMSDQETPTIYDFWTAVWTLSSVLGREVVIDRPRAPVYLNWYIILVAESGVTRKSTAVRVAKSLVQCVLGDRYLISSRTTQEQLLYQMELMTLHEQRATVRIAISELVTFLGKTAVGNGMVGLLTDLYDCPEYRYGAGTLARGEHELRNVYISFLSASTPSWLIRAVSPDVIEGGFTSRCMFVVSEKRKKKVAWPIEPDPELYDLLVDHLNDIRKEAEHFKQVTIHKSGINEFNKWYKQRRDHADPYRASFESREDSHVLRLAACLAINDGSWEIRTAHIKASIDAVQQIKQDGCNMFSGGFTSSKIILGLDRLRVELIEAGSDGIQHTLLTQRIKDYMSIQNINDALAIMHELGLVKKWQVVDTGTRGGPKPTYWKATAKLSSTGKVSTMVFDIMEPKLQ